MLKKYTKRILDWWKAQDTATKAEIIGVILAILTLLYTFVVKQDYSYGGSVVDELGEPVTDALVIVTIGKEEITLKTDDVGKFTFMNSKQSLDLDLKVAKNGYLPSQKRHFVNQADPIIPSIVLIATSNIRKTYDQLKVFLNDLTQSYKKYDSQLVYKFDDFATYKQSEGKLYVQPYHPKTDEDAWQYLVEQWLAGEIALYLKNAEVTEESNETVKSKEVLQVKAVNLPENDTSGVDIAIYLNFKAYSERILVAKLILPFCFIYFPEIHVNGYNVPDLSMIFENNSLFLEKKVATRKWFVIPKGKYAVTGKIGELQGTHDPIEFKTLWQKTISFHSSKVEESALSYMSKVVLLDPMYHHVGDNEYTVEYWNAYNVFLKKNGDSPLPANVRGDPKPFYSHRLNWSKVRETYKISEKMKIVRAYILMKLYLLKPRRSAPAIIAINDRILRFLNDFVREEEMPVDAEIEIPTDILTDIIYQRECEIIVTVFDDTVESLDYDKREDFIFKNLALKLEYAMTVALNQ